MIIANRKEVEAAIDIIDDGLFLLVNRTMGKAGDWFFFADWFFVLVNERALFCIHRSEQMPIDNPTIGMRQSEWREARQAFATWIEDNKHVVLRKLNLKDLKLKVPVTI